MKERYYEFTDDNGSVIVTVCELTLPEKVERVEVDFTKNMMGKSVLKRKLRWAGIAIRSPFDAHDDKTAREIAYARAVRALKGRRSCWAKRRIVLEQLAKLSYLDMMNFVSRFTRGRIINFPKGVTL